MPVKLIGHDIGWNASTQRGLIKLLFENQHRANINVGSLGELAGWAAILASGNVMGDGTWLYTDHHGQLPANIRAAPQQDDFDIRQTR